MERLINWYTRNRYNVLAVIFVLLFALISMCLIFQTNEIKEIKKQNQKVKDRLIQVETECKLFKQDLEDKYGY